MKYLIAFLLLILATPSQAQQMNIPSAQQLSQQLQLNCAQRPNGDECLRILKETTSKLAIEHHKQFGPAGPITVRDPQYAADAKEFLAEYCNPVITKTDYKTATQQDKIFLITDITNDVNLCLKGLKATKAEDKTGRVQIRLNEIDVLYYYNICLRGNLVDEAKQECQYMGSQLR